MRGVGTMRVDWNRARLMVVALSPLVIGSAVGSAVLSSSYVGRSIGTGVSYSLYGLVIQAIVSTILGSLVVGALYWVVQTGSRRGRRLVVALVVSPILGFVSIFVGETLLLVMFKGTTSVVYGFLLVVSLGVSLMSLALIIVDVIPPVIRNLFVIFYGSIFGTFLGVTMLTSTIFVITISVIIEDYVLTRYHPRARAQPLIASPGKDPFEYAHVRSGPATVGAGDFIVFSLVGAHAITHFPFYVWSMSFLLGALGIAVNVFVVLREGSILPAIPLPTFLALFPWIVHIVALSLLL